MLSFLQFTTPVKTDHFLHLSKLWRHRPVLFASEGEDSGEQLRLIYLQKLHCHSKEAFVGDFDGNIWHRLSSTCAGRIWNIADVLVVNPLSKCTITRVLFQACLQHKQFRLCWGVEWSQDLGELREFCDSLSGRCACAACNTFMMLKRGKKTYGVHVRKVFTA